MIYETCVWRQRDDLGVLHSLVEFARVSVSYILPLHVDTEI